MALLALLGFFLLVASPTFGKAIPDSWNIACGRNTTVKADNGLIFEGDGAYIGTGVSAQVGSAAANNLSAEFSTLRTFPKTQWKKNCYRIPVEQGTKVRVRTRFYYGNYDGKNSLPEFGIYYDSSANCRAAPTLFLQTSWFACEVFYVTSKKQGTDICFVRTEWADQDPIVSTIEVTRIPNNMYNRIDFTANSLFLRRARFAFGADHDIEYPDDAYNRRWRANSLQGDEGGENKPVIVRRKSLIAPNTSTLADAPPSLLFQAGAMAPMVDNSTTGNLTIRTTWLSTKSFPIYFTMYFTEVESQRNNGKFVVFQNGQPLNSSVISKVETGVAQELSGIIDNASNETKFDLVPTEGSTLQPIISGMEVFYIMNVSVGTDSNDVKAVSMLQSNFTALRNWNGDPCLPDDFNWEWVYCVYRDRYRIEGLKLNGYQLSGNLPDFSGLEALTDIDLSNNSFRGPIPEFLALLPKLKSLDLSNNDFDRLPPSLANNTRITLNITGNAKLERQNASTLSLSPSPRQESPTPAACCPRLTISPTLALLLLLLATVTTM